MFTSIFEVIGLVLKLVGLWDQFLSWSDAKRIADIEKNRQERNAAVDDQKTAQTEDQFDKDQSNISSHHP